MTRCAECHTELPMGARYCVSCGKEVYQIKLRALGRIGHRELVPYREEWEDDDQEFVGITPSLVTPAPEAAALILYGNPTMKGESISLSIHTYSSPQVMLRQNVLYANVTPREVRGKTYYVALFPRIYFFTYGSEKADITHASCELAGLPRRLSGIRIEKKESVTLYPGLVTEVDWSRIGYKGVIGGYEDYDG